MSKYWQGFMNWSLEEGWTCEICGGYYGLTWGLTHAECRCNNCHTVYYMRADDKDRTMLTKPRCLLKPNFHEAAKEFYTQTGKPIDEATINDWVNFGALKSKFEEEGKGGRR